MRRKVQQRDVPLDRRRRKPSSSKKNQKTNALGLVQQLRGSPTRPATHSTHSTATNTNTRKTNRPSPRPHSYRASLSKQPPPSIQTGFINLNLNSITSVPSASLPYISSTTLLSNTHTHTNTQMNTNKNTNLTTDTTLSSSNNHRNNHSIDLNNIDDITLPSRGNQTDDDNNDNPPDSPTRVRDHQSLMRRAKGVEEMSEGRFSQLEDLAVKAGPNEITSGPMYVTMLRNLTEVAERLWLSDKVDLILQNSKSLYIQDGTLLIQKGDPIHHLILVLNDGGLLASPHKIYERGTLFGEGSLTRVSHSESVLIAVGNCQVLIVDGRSFRSDLQKHHADRKERVRDILRMSEQFKNLHFSQLDELGKHLQPTHIKIGDNLMQEGDIGADILFIESGTCEVRIDMGKGNTYKVVGNCGVGDVVGEGALFDQNSKRSATLVATSNVSCFRLLFQDFHRICPTATEDLKIAFLVRVLKAVKRNETDNDDTDSSSSSKFGNMPDSLLNELCRLSTMSFYKEGSYIIKEGDPVTDESCLYIVKRGTVGFEKTFDEKEGPRELGQVFGGSVFGEGSLLNRSVPRSASCKAISASGVECALISFSNYDAVVTEDVTKALKEEFQVRDKGSFNDARLSDLVVLRVLGEGSYGKVYLIRHSVTGRVCAMKEVNIAQVEASNYGRYINQECALLRSCRHPFIIKVIGSLLSQKCVYMALEARLGGELLHSIRNNYDVVSNSTSVRFYIAQVIEVLSYLHRLGIIYRDLKPENLLVGDDGYLTLIDFSVSKKCSGETFTLCGTPEYTAPEIYRMTGHSTASDWWSAGVLMHELSVGIPPFQGETTLEIMTAIQRYERLWPDSIFLRDSEDELNKITVASEKLIKSLLCPKPYDRLGRASHNNSNELYRHPFFNGFSWKSLRAKTLRAPFIPNVNSKYDGSNFDEDKQGSGGGKAERVLGNDRDIYDVDVTKLPAWTKEFGQGK